MIITPELIWIDILLVAAAIFGVRGMRTFMSAMRNRSEKDAPMKFYRGARGVISAIALVTIAAGLWFDSHGLLLFGIVFLAEELYETLMAESVVRWGRKKEERKSQE